MSETATAPKVSTLRDRLNQMTPAEKLAAMRRLQKIRSGEIRVQPRCGHCRSAGLERDPEEPGTKVLCMSCGRRSDKRAIRRARQLEMEAIVVDGELR